MTVFLPPGRRRALTAYLLYLALAPAAASAAPATKPVTSGAEFPVYNFRVTSLPDGWKWRDNSKPIGQIVAYAFQPTTGEEFLIKVFNVGVERQRTPRAALADLQALVSSRGTTVISPTVRDVRAAGMDGARVIADTRKNDRPGHWIGFTGVHGGREFDFAYFSPRPADESLKTATDLFDRVELIAPSATIHAADLAGPPPFESPVYKYRLSMPGGWSRVAANAGMPDVDAGAELADHSTVLITPALLTPGLAPADVAQSFLDIYGWKDVRAGALEKVQAGKFVGYRATRSSVIGGRSATEKACIWVGAGMAFFIDATSTLEHPSAVLDEALGSFDVSHVVGSADPDVRRQLLSPQDLFSNTRDERIVNPLKPNTRGLVQNHLGILAWKRGDTRQAAELFELSLQYQLDALVTGNLILALTYDGQVGRGELVTEAALRRYPRDPLVIRPAVRFYRVAKDTKAFRDLCRRSLDGGLVDDQVLYEYASSLLDAEDVATADAVVSTYKRRSHGPAVVAAEAEILLSQNRAANAVAMLDDYLKNPPTVPTPALETPDDVTVETLHTTRIVALTRNRQFDRATTELAARERAGLPGRIVEELRGQLKLIAGDTAAAKAAFEKAKSLGLDAATAEQWLRLVASASEQGKNDTVRDVIDPVSAPADLFPASPARAEPLDRSFGAAYRRSWTAIRLDAGKPQRSTTDEVIEIYDQSGIDMFTTVKLTLNPLDERLFINCVEVLDETGKVISKGKPDDFYVLDKSSDGATGSEAATLEQTVNIPVAGLRVGCTLHVQTTREFLHPGPRTHFHEHFASHALPVGEAAVFVTGNNADHVAIAEFNGAHRTVRKDGVAWCFAGPPCLTGEPCAPDLADFVPGIAIGDGRTNWRDEGLDYLKIISDRLKPDPAVAREAKQLNVDGKPPMDRLRAVVAYVQSQYAYKAIAFGPRAYVPSPPARIIEQRYGDCKDQALLIHLLLREVGIESRLALVRMNGAVYPSIASSDQFDHMIVHVPYCDGAAWWIDTTNHDLQALEPTPGPGLLGRHALVLDPTEPKLVELPEWNPDGSGLSTRRSLAIGEDGVMSVSDHTTIRGLMAGYFRTVLRSSERSRRNEAAARMLGVELTDVKTWSVKIADLDDPASPLTIDLTYAPRQKLKKSGTHLIGELPTPAERVYLLSEPVETRRLPFKISGRANYEVTLDVTWPKGWTAEGLDAPPPSHLDTAWDDARLTFERPTPGPDGTPRLTGHLQVKSHAGVFPAAKYADFCQSRQELLDAWSIPLMFQTNP